MRNLIAATIFIVVCLLTLPARAATKLIIWNVGQGLWVTEVQEDVCRHFDTGGERPPNEELERTCRGKKNQFLFSHWDWDHVSFAKLAAYRLRDSCLLRAPAGDANSFRQKALPALTTCSPSLPPSIAEITPGAARHIDRKRKLESNDASRVFLVNRSVLLPGDSTSARERIWSRDPRVAQARWLVLGHHGSRTSTSPELLKAAKRLRLAIASSRKKKYGHPHPIVRTRLKQKGIAVLSTEDWGTIHLEMDSEVPLVPNPEKNSERKPATKPEPRQGPPSKTKSPSPLRR